MAGYESKKSDGWEGAASVYDGHAQILVKKYKSGIQLRSIKHKSGVLPIGYESRYRRSCQLYNARDRRLVLSCETPQLDIDEVTIKKKPCLTSSAADGSTYVWDTRRTDRVLHILKHGESRAVVADGNVDDSSGVTSAIWLNSVQMITGGSDGAVKLWDVSLSNPFVVEFATVDPPMKSMALSPNKEQLVIGENRGAAH